MTHKNHKEHFSAIAIDYDQLTSCASNHELRKLLKGRLSKYRHLEVLDLGTGTGAFGSLFQKNECAVWGVDHNSRMLKIAAQKGIFPINISIDRVSDISRQFDLISARQLFQYLSDHTIDILASQIQTLLRPCGHLVLHHMTAPTQQSRLALKKCMSTPGNPHPFRSHEFYCSFASKVGLRHHGSRTDSIRTTETLEGFAGYRAITADEAKLRFMRLAKHELFEVAFFNAYVEYTRFYSYVEASKEL